MSLLELMTLAVLALLASGAAAWGAVSPYPRTTMTKVEPQSQVDEVDRKARMFVDAMRAAWHDDSNHSPLSLAALGADDNETLHALASEGFMDCEKTGCHLWMGNEGSTITQPLCLALPPLRRWGAANMPMPPLLPIEEVRIADILQEKAIPLRRWGKPNVPMPSLLPIEEVRGVSGADVMEKDGVNISEGRPPEVCVTWWSDLQTTAFLILALSSPFLVPSNLVSLILI